VKQERCGNKNLFYSEMRRPDRWMALRIGGNLPPARKVEQAKRQEMREQLDGHTSSDLPKQKGPVQSCYNGVRSDFGSKIICTTAISGRISNGAAKTTRERVGNDCPKVLDIGFGHGHAVNENPDH
jgi:hypothetical protein